MTTTVTFLGYDRDGDQVWRRADGRVFAAADENEARAEASAGGSWLLADYTANFGTITREPPS